jgi:curved DNA-binding protein CbpA
MNADSNKEEFECDWYGILGLEVGSSVDEINRSARKLSIKYHPDKTSDPNAPAKFLLIQRAKDILNDETKKKAIDEHFASLRKRQAAELERTQRMTGQQKMFREKLEKQMAEAEAGTRIDENEVMEREIRKNSRIIQALQRENAQMMEEAQSQHRDHKLDYMEIYRKIIAERMDTKKENEKEIKVKWKKTLRCDENSLKHLFQQFGAIESIKISTSKGSTGYIRFIERQSSLNAVETFANSSDYQVKLNSSSSSTTTTQQMPSFSFPEAPINSGQQSFAEGKEEIDYDNEVLNLFTRHVNYDEFEEKEKKILAQLRALGDLLKQPE